MQPVPNLRAWDPHVPGVSEVLHAYFPAHAYPLHTHDTWTLLLVDSGAVRYDLERHEHAALGSRVTLLPPDVPHDGRAATTAEFRKRVVYLDADSRPTGTSPGAASTGPAACCSPGTGPPTSPRRWVSTTRRTSPGTSSACSG